MKIALSLLLGLSAASSIAAQPLGASEFSSRILAAHNRARAAAGVPALIWDDQLAAGAAAHARQMAATGIFGHSDRKARRGVGENLWMGTRGAYNPEAMVGTWAAERAVFMPGTFPNISRTGNWADAAHYTQMIWPGTTRIGCAIGTNGRTDYLVCRYAPAGNIDGRMVGRPTERG